MIRIIVILVVSFVFIYESRKNKKLEQFLMGIFLLVEFLREIIPNLNSYKNIVNILDVLMGLLLVSSIFIFLKRKVYTKLNSHK